MTLASAKRSADLRGNADPAGADYLARVQQIAPALAAAGDEIDRRRELPEAIVEGLIERGLFRLLLPHSLDGAELLPAQYIPIIEAVAKIDASTAWCLNQNSGCSMTAALLAPEIAREIFGGPHVILAWGPGPGEARVAPGGYRVTASWSFASGSQHASWLGCHVPIVEADGTPRLRPDGTPVVRTMLFPKSSTEFTTSGTRSAARHRQQPVFGQGSVRAGGLFGRCCRAATGDGRGRPALPVQQPVAYAGGFAGSRSASRAACSVISSSGATRSRGARNTLRNNNVIQSQVAQAEARLSSARGWLLQSFETITAAVAQRGHITLDERMNIRLASTFAIHTGVEVVDVLYQAAGATAIFNENPFERRFRDVHSVAQQLQGRQQHFETVGQHLMGLQADTGWL
jgi:alkylation response protein AidB-like acyl-CoA dehydrogenase